MPVDYMLIIVLSTSCVSMLTKIYIQSGQYPNRMQLDAAIQIESGLDVSKGRNEFSDVSHDGRFASAAQA